MKILALDTATKVGSVAIMEDDNVLAESTLNADITHSETLLPSINDMLKETALSMTDMDLFALTLGPGSFTGIRIGVSTIKGFAFALNRPVVGVSTLEALAYNFSSSPLKITPILDARRGEVYTATFRWEGDRMLRLSEDRAVPPEKMLEEIDEETLFAGDGLEKYGDMIKSRLGTLANEATKPQGLIRASSIATLGLERYEKGETLDIATLTPLYLRKSEAEIKREKGLLKNC